MRETPHRPQERQDDVDTSLIEDILKEFDALESPAASPVSRHDLQKALETFFAIVHTVRIQDFFSEKHTLEPKNFRLKANIDTMHARDIFLGKERDFFGYMPEKDPHIITDGPLLFQVEHYHEGRWNTISILSFRIDFARKLLLVEQIQGSDTGIVPQYTNTERRTIRSQFSSATPEYALFTLAQTFAQRIGMHGIGIQRAIHNKSRELRERANAHPEKDTTLYAKTARKFGLRNPIPSAYSAYEFDMFIEERPTQSPTQVSDGTQ